MKKQAKEARPVGAVLLFVVHILDMRPIEVNLLGYRTVP